MNTDKTKLDAQAISAKPLLADSYKLHWAIRLRKKLLINGSWKWNALIRDWTAWAEVNL